MSTSKPTIYHAHMKLTSMTILHLQSPQSHELLCMAIQVVSSTIISNFYETIISTEEISQDPLQTWPNLLNMFYVIQLLQCTWLAITTNSLSVPYQDAHYMMLQITYTKTNLIYVLPYLKRIPISISQVGLPLKIYLSNVNLQSKT